MSRTVISPTGCWLWQGFTNAKGYGVIGIGSRLDGTYRPGRPAHRVAYEEMVGPIPEDLTIDHLCEVKNCWNPDHLEPVTNAENKRRAGLRATACRRGHPRTPENTSTTSRGTARCNLCRKVVGS